MERMVLDDIVRNNLIKLGIIDAIKIGSVFVYPTDTVYGIGCDAGNSKSVERIRDMKDTEHPFSVIAPSMDWIRKNLVADKQDLKYLPGPYTLILKKKKSDFLSAASPGDTLGVRMPNHRFADIIAEAGMPFITTSANITGQPTITSPDNIPDRILKHINFVIDDGEITGKPSTVIDMSGEDYAVLRK